MHILINGGTGFIGSKLCKHFIGLGYQVDVLTRSLRNKKNKLSQSINYITDLNNIDSSYDVIVNLSGEPLNRNRWNEQVKKAIYDSRIQSTQKIIDYIKTCRVKPKLLITGSAIGFYGHSPDVVFTENSPSATSEFIHKLCADWEMTGMKAREYGVRVCVIRTGIVLEKHHGALAEMIRPFSLGLGAQFGNGNQWMSWIHISDVVSAIEFLIHHSEIEGPFNLTSPGPITHKEFTKKLAKILKRPVWIRLPDFVVKILFGEMGEVLLLIGQKVIPDKLLKAGYKFKFPTLDLALGNILK